VQLHSTATAVHRRGVAAVVIRWRDNRLLMRKD